MFSDATKIRCVVYPVGRITQTVFESFFQRLEQCSVVELVDVTRDPKDKSLLQHLSWKTAKVRFNFLRDPCAFEDRDDLRLREGK